MRAIAAFLFFLVAACTPSRVAEEVLMVSERSIIRGAISDVSRGDSASLARKVPPELANRVSAIMPQMRKALPSPPLDISVLSANWADNGQVRQLNAVYQVHGQTGWALVEAATQTEQGRTLLTSIYVQPTPTNPRNLNAFELGKVEATHWAMLLAIVAAIGVTLAALVKIWRTEGYNRRWVWTVGVLIGVMTLRLNWSSGELSFQPLSFQLFSVSATKQPIYAPWSLAVSLPLFAIIALLRRTKKVREDVNSTG